MARQKNRLDALLVSQQRVHSLKEAQALILTGKVIINNQKIDKPGTLVPIDSPITILDHGQSYVGRGGHKLAGALQTFDISVTDHIALDIGISTGGFTDCLLQQGAKHVIGVDVGYGQVDWKLQSDSRVTLLERTNARHPDLIHKGLDQQQKAPLLEKVSLIVMDVSFISVLLILPSLRTILPQQTRFLVLIKPQFEATREELPDGGIITDDTLRYTILNRVKTELVSSGFQILGDCDSSTPGTKGNREFFLYLSSL